MTAVLVTGAAGFVGQALCAALALQGHRVSRATRTSSARLQSPSFAVGDIGPDTNWHAAITGCDAVIHLAARVHVTNGWSHDAADDFHRVNVEGSENLARQAARAGVRRFVFLSSVKVNGEVSTNRAFVETDPFMTMDAYGASKAEAEKRLRIISTETGMELIVVRPPLVYGPGVKANFLSLLRAIDAGLPLPLASIENRRSLIYLGNLVSAVETCLTHAGAANRTFFVSDDYDISTPDLVEAIAASLGRSTRLFRSPPFLLRAASAAFGRKDGISRLIESLQVDISHIRNELGWRPPFSMEKGLAETAVWFRSRRQ